MNKKDLKEGMVVETYNGTLLLVINYYYDNTYSEMIFANNNSWIKVGHYNNDLTRMDFIKKYDENYNKSIKRVYRVKINKYNFENVFNKDNLVLLWERPEKKEMTIEEIEKELGYKIKIIK